MLLQTMSKEEVKMMLSALSWKEKLAILAVLQPRSRDPYLDTYQPLEEKIDLESELLMLLSPDIKKVDFLFVSMGKNDERRTATLMNLSQEDLHTILSLLSKDEKKKFFTSMSPLQQASFLHNCGPEDRALFVDLMLKGSQTTRHIFLDSISDEEKALQLARMGSGKSKKSRAEALAQRMAYLDSLDPEARLRIMKLMTEAMNPEDLAEFLNALSDEERANVLAMMGPESRLKYMQTLSPDERARMEALMAVYMSDADLMAYMDSLSDDEKLAFLANMPCDVAAGLLLKCDDSLRDGFMASLPQDEKELMLAGMDKKAASMMTPSEREAFMKEQEKRSKAAKEEMDKLARGKAELEQRKEKEKDRRAAAKAKALEDKSKPSNTKKKGLSLKDQIENDAAELRSLDGLSEDELAARLADMSDEQRERYFAQEVAKGNMTEDELEEMRASVKSKKKEFLDGPDGVGAGIDDLIDGQLKGLPKTKEADEPTSCCGMIEETNKKLKHDLHCAQVDLEDANMRLLEVFAGGGETDKLKKMKKDLGDLEGNERVTKKYLEDTHGKDKVKKGVNLKKSDDTDSDEDKLIPEDEVWIKKVGEPCPMPEMHERMAPTWDWLNPDGEWVAYSEEVSKMFEDAHEDYQKYFSCCIRGVPLQVYLQSRIQVNMITNEEAALQRTFPHIGFNTLGPNDTKASSMTPEEKRLQDKLIKAGTYTRKEYLQLKAAGMLETIEQDWKIELPAQAYSGEDDVSKYWGKASGSAGERKLYEMQSEIDEKMKEMVGTKEILNDLKLTIVEDTETLEELFKAMDA